MYAIGHQAVLSLLRWSSGIQPGLHVPRLTREFSHPSYAFRLQGYHLLWPHFPECSTKHKNLMCIAGAIREAPTTPHTQRRQAITRMRFRLFPVRSPLLGESLLFSFPRATKMFQFARLPPASYGFTRRYQVFNLVGFPIRRPGDHRLLTASPGLSWSTTSFFGCWCQGIPRVPFVA